MQQMAEVEDSWLKQTRVIQNRTTVRLVDVGMFARYDAATRPTHPQAHHISVYLEHVVA